MAKERKIKRDDDPVTAEEAPVTAEEAPVTAVKKEVKPVNATILLRSGRITAAVGIRVASGFVFYNEGCKMVRIPVDKEKAITVTIKQ